MAAFVAVLGSVRWGWRFGLQSNDTAVVVGTVIAGTSLVLIGVTAIVALLAYLAATGAPDLVPSIAFRFSDENTPVFSVESLPSTPHVAVISFRQTEGIVRVTNRSRFSARNPGMHVGFQNVGRFDPQLNRGWTIVSYANQVGPTAIQWDGGVDGLIHGKWSRTLPQLDFDGVAAVAGIESSITITVVADGFGPREWTFPIRFLEADAYAAYSAERAAKYSD